MQSTEKVSYIDSIVIAKNRLTQAIALHKEAGIVDSLKNIIIDFNFPEYHLGNAYLNELSDKVIFSAKCKSDSSFKNLYMSERIGKRWTSPTLITNLKGRNLDYPYLLSDGLTLYYSSICDEGLGGYDIYITRFDERNNVFLTSENLGMPFNSPANDYFCIIDEHIGIGWIATDRNQNIDSVCIYSFVPNSIREVYNPRTIDEQQLIKYARIESIKDCQADNKTISTIRERLKKIKETTTKGRTTPKFIINDSICYYHLAEIKSDAARQIAIELNQEIQIYNNEIHELDELRNKINSQNYNKSLLQTILKFEKTCLERKKKIIDLEKKMRKAELEI